MYFICPFRYFGVFPVILAGNNEVDKVRTSTFSFAFYLQLERKKHEILTSLCLFSSRLALARRPSLVACLLKNVIILVTTVLLLL